MIGWIKANRRQIYGLILYNNDILTDRIGSFLKRKIILKNRSYFKQNKKRLMTNYP